MSSINPYYTFQYSQPDEYRFSHDSVFLARHVYEWARVHHAHDLSHWRVLDLCAGSGVVGLDFLFHLTANNLPHPSAVDFLEIQDVYKSHFNENVQRLRNTNVAALGLHTRFLNVNYDKLGDTTDTYDLILCNPPFFDVGQGKLSPSAFKNRCRFFIDASRESLLTAVHSALKPGAACFMLMREVPREWPASLAVAWTGEIRGTRLILMRKSFCETQKLRRLDKKYPLQNW